MTKKINDSTRSEANRVTFDEMLAACNKAGVSVSAWVYINPHDLSVKYIGKFYHRLGNGQLHGPFEHEDQAYEDAFHTYCLWPW